jgi:hypothetical protein
VWRRNLAVHPPAGALRKPGGGRRSPADQVGLEVRGCGYTPGRPRESDRSWTRAAVRVHVLDLPARASAKMMITTEAVKNAIRELEGAHRRARAGTVGSELSP